MKKIFIAGVTGLLGQAYLRKAKDLGWIILGLSREAFPLEKHIKADVRTESDYLSTIKDFKPDVIVNCVALVDLKRCEEDRKAAEELNSLFPGTLANLALEGSASFIHISTDHLYDGLNAPYTENDPTSPVNWYGVSKLEGERRVELIKPDSLIIRTNIVGKRGDKKRPSFVEWLENVLKNEENVTLFSDYITSSAHVDDVVRGSLDLLEKKAFGVFNVATRDYSSKFEFGVQLAEKIGCSTRSVHSGLIGSKKKLVPPRPANLSLDCSKAEQVLGRHLPTQAETIEKLSLEFGR